MRQTALKDIVLNRAQPLQPQLYRQLVEMILSGRLPAATRLPSSRQLAEDVNISRNTVLAVYDQLKAEGFVQSQSGRGIFVHHDIRSVQPSPIGASQDQVRPPPNRAGENAVGTWASDQDNTLPFTPGLPDLSAFPIKAWNRVWHHHESRTALMGYDSSQGFLPLRQILAHYLQVSRGLRCHFDQIIITQGAQQALSIIADVLLQAGDDVLMENPGYRGARRVFQDKQVRLKPIPLKHQAIDVSALTTSATAKLLYCTPTHQYPMGGSLDIAERLQLIRWATAQQSWIIEDDYDSEFQFASKPFAAMQGMEDKAPVLYVGSFSKTLLPAMRIGYLVVPETLVEPMVFRKRVSGGESPLLIQAVLAEFIETGQFQRHLRRMRQLYKQKWERLMAAIAQQLNGLVTPIAESAGMHLVTKCQADDLELAKALYQRGFGPAPLSDHFFADTPESGLVLGFASATEQDIEKCVKAIRDLIA